MALVFSVINDLHRSMDGVKPSSDRVGKQTVVMPSMSKVILRNRIRRSNKKIRIGVLVVEIPRRREDDFITGIGQGDNRSNESHVTSRGECNVFCLDIDGVSVSDFHLLSKGSPEGVFTRREAVSARSGIGSIFGEGVEQQRRWGDTGNTLRHVNKGAFRSSLVGEAPSNDSRDPGGRLSDPIKFDTPVKTYGGFKVLRTLGEIRKDNSDVSVAIAERMR